MAKTLLAASKTTVDIIAQGVLRDWVKAIDSVVGITGAMAQGIHRGDDVAIGIVDCSGKIRAAHPACWSGDRWHHN